MVIRRGVKEFQAAHSVGGVGPGYGRWGGQVVQEMFPRGLHMVDVAEPAGELPA